MHGYRTRWCAVLQPASVIIRHSLISIQLCNSIENTLTPYAKDGGHRLCPPFFMSFFWGVPFMQSRGDEGLLHCCCCSSFPQPRRDHENETPPACLSLRRAHFCQQPNAQRRMPPASSSMRWLVVSLSIRPSIIAINTAHGVLRKFSWHIKYIGTRLIHQGYWGKKELSSFRARGRRIGVTDSSFCRSLVNGIILPPIDGAQKWTLKLVLLLKVSPHRQRTKSLQLRRYRSMPIFSTFTLSPWPWRWAAFMWIGRMDCKMDSLYSWLDSLWFPLAILVWFFAQQKWLAFCRFQEEHTALPVSRWAPTLDILLDIAMPTVVWHMLCVACSHLVEWWS